MVGFNKQIRGDMYEKSRMRNTEEICPTIKMAE